MQTNTSYEIPPIAFMIFNRPDYTQRVFEAIRRVKPKKLFVVADGPRTHGERAVCEQTRAIIDRVDWDCEVHKNYAKKNLGLKERFHTGLNWFFEYVESGIILEDDCLPHPSFFRFAAEMLEKYRGDDCVTMITGDNFLSNFQVADSYFFSRYFPIWGWATWRRSWEKYDVSMTGWEDPANKEKLKKNYSQPYMYEHVRKIFDGVRDGKLSTWDIQWLYACLINDGFCITPNVNLVSNIGMAGTHSGGDNQNLPVYDIYAKEFTHPQHIAAHTAYDNAFYEKNFKPSETSMMQKIRLEAVAIAAQHETLKKLYRFITGKKK